MSDIVKEIERSQKKVKQTTGKYSKFLDPFVVVGILVLFAIPALTIINLTPTYVPPLKQPDVLGARDNESVEILLHMEVKDGISVEKLSQNDENVYTLYINDMPEFRRWASGSSCSNACSTSASSYIASPYVIPDCPITTTCQ